MMIKKILLSCGAALAMTATPAFAQQAPGADTELYVGGQVGYHMIDEIDFNDVGINASTDIEGLTYGAFGGVTFASESNITLGVEGNYSFGNDSIDREYGVAGLVGTRVGSNSRIFLKGGYQWVDFDIATIASESADDLGLSGVDRDDFIAGVTTFPGLEDTGSGFLAGIGADVGVGPGFLRLGVDTIEFDTVKASAGFGFKF